jgi:hypothetical protein
LSPWLDFLVTGGIIFAGLCLAFYAGRWWARGSGPDDED